MPTEILMPALSPTMEEGKLAKWLVKEGQTIKAGDIIAEIETDKATMEVEAVDEGKLGKILVPEGTEGVKVNTPIAVILSDGEDASALTAEAPPKGNGAGAPQAAPRDEGAPVSERGATDARATVDVRVQETKPDTPAPGYDSAAEIPEGTEMMQMTMREALRDAMA